MEMATCNVATLQLAFEGHTHTHRESSTHAAHKDMAEWLGTALGGAGQLAGNACLSALFVLVVVISELHFFGTFGRGN